VRPAGRRLFLSQWSVPPNNRFDGGPPFVREAVVKKRIFIFITMSVFLMPGCRLVELVRPGESPVDRLERECHILQADLDNVKKQTDERNADLRRAYADIKAELNGMRSELQSLRGEQEQTAYTLECHLRDFEAWRRQQEAALKALQQPPEPAKTGESSDAGPAVPVTGTAESAAKTGGTVPANAPVMDEDAFYESGRQLFDKGDYAGARNIFEQFLTQYPQSRQTDNAYFWIGETYYREGRYEKAILEYQEVIDKFPDGNKVPASLLKQGMAFNKIKDDINARLVLKRLIREYPDSQEAKNAGHLLQE
jgi:tol-pal system protein YbgF